MMIVEETGSAGVKALDRSVYPHGLPVVVLGLILLLGIGLTRIVTTYHVFNQTFDEPYHVGGGMEWWDLGTYQSERKEAPLGRIAAALGPYLDGLRTIGHEYTPAGVLAEGNGILYSRNSYDRNLTLARLGILPFFLIASFMVWHWSDRVYGRRAAWMACLLFTALPGVLAHAGLATTDMAITACLTIALYALTRWLEAPGMRQTVALGAAVGLAVLAKFTAFLFLPTCGLVLFLLSSAVERTPFATLRKAIFLRSRLLMISLVVAFVVIWAGYRFSLTRPLKPGGGSQRIINAAFGTQGKLHDLASAIGNTPLPLGELLAGLGAAWDQNKEGTPAYIFGTESETGWWYFFPAALAFKTPLPFLLLVGAGIIFIARGARRPLIWQQWAPICCVLSMVAVSLPARLDSGVRYMLPTYPLLAMVAGFGLTNLFSAPRSRRIAAFCGTFLLLWFAGSSISAHPDYLAYFNELAGRSPERILLNSDLDWGQDLKRLSERLRQLGVHEVSLSYLGTADVTRHGLPAVRELVPYQPVTGWVAISLYNLKLRSQQFQRVAGKSYSPWAWLERYQPVETVGKSIRLYYVPPDSATASRN